eukprot:gene14423-5479_t
MFIGVLILAAAYSAYAFQRAPSLQSIKRGEEIASSFPRQQPGEENLYGTPPYIVDLYKTLAKNPSPLPYGAEFVRSFPARGIAVLTIIVLQILHLCRPKKTSFILKFNIHIPKREKILHAMLHFCLKRETLKNISSIEFTNVRSDKTMRLTKTEFGTSRCQLFPVTPLLRRKSSVNTFSLVLRMVLISQRDEESQVKASWRRKVSSPVEIVIFSSEKYPVSPFLRFRLPTNQQELTKRDADNHKKLTKRGCHRKSLIVNFVGLGYKDMVAPTIFDIKQCNGACRYPLGSMSNPTQHSLIQQLLHSLYGKRVAKSTCCSPRSYVPLTTMIKDSYSGRIAIRSLENMIVAECGCQ